MGKRIYYTGMYRVRTTYIKEPELNTGEQILVTYDRLLQLFPFVKFISEFDTLIIIRNSTKQEIKRISVKGR